MRIGVVSGFDGRRPPDFVAAAGRIAEERGFHSFFVPEHVLFFQEYASRYPYAEDGRLQSILTEKSTERGDPQRLVSFSFNNKRFTSPTRKIEPVTSTSPLFPALSRAETSACSGDSTASQGKPRRAAALATVFGSWALGFGGRVTIRCCT